jgi:hypothetical protein
MGLVSCPILLESTPIHENPPNPFKLNIDWLKDEVLLIKLRIFGNHMTIPPRNLPLSNFNKI